MSPIRHFSRHTHAKQFCERTACFAAELRASPAEHRVRQATSSAERQQKTVAGLRLAVRDQLKVAERDVLPRAAWVEALEADSLDLVELIMAIEDEFGVQIPDEDAEKIVMIRDAEAWLAKRGMP